MVNSELFRQIADRIEKEPESYDQQYVAREPGKWGGCLFCHAEEILGLSHHEFNVIDNVWIPSQKTSEALGLSPGEAITLFTPRWKPRPGLTVPEALRLIADGKSVSEVSA